LRPSGPKPDALTGLRYTPYYPPKLSLTTVAFGEGGSEGGKKSRKNITVFLIIIAIIRLICYFPFSVCKLISL
ncbi:MAG: hypothetical protein WCS03_18520, partial [Bacteroidota bacterium]